MAERGPPSKCIRRSPVTAMILQRPTPPQLNPLLRRGEERAEVPSFTVLGFANDGVKTVKTVKMVTSGVRGEKSGRIWSDLVGLAAPWSGGVMGMGEWFMVPGSRFMVDGGSFRQSAGGRKRQRSPATGRDPAQWRDADSVQDRRAGESPHSIQTAAPAGWGARPCSGRAEARPSEFGAGPEFWGKCFCRSSFRGP